MKTTSRSQRPSGCRSPCRRWYRAYDVARLRAEVTVDHEVGACSTQRALESAYGVTVVADLLDP